MDGVNPRATIQKVNLEEDSLRIQVPFSMSVSGPSQSKIDKQKLLECTLFKYKTQNEEKIFLKKVQSKVFLSILRRWKV